MLTQRPDIYMQSFLFRHSTVLTLQTGWSPYIRYDALLGLLADQEDPGGAGRRRTEDRGKALAGKSTLNRLELTPKEAGKEDRYKKNVASHAGPPEGDRDRCGRDR